MHCAWYTALRHSNDGESYVSDASLSMWRGESGSINTLRRSSCCFFLLRGYGSADTRQRFHLDHRRTEYGRPEVPEVAFDIYTALQHSVSRHGWKILGLKKVFRFCRFFKGFERFLYKDRTRKYDPKAHEKHPITVRPSPFHRLHTAQKSPVSEGEEHRQDEIDESHKS